MVFSLYQYKVSDRDFNLGIAMPENYARTAMPGLENTSENLVRAASAEFTPVDKKEPTPLVETGSKHRIERHT